MNDLLRKDNENVWHPFTPLTGADVPLLITKGEGVYLKTEDGRSIIDAISSWWVNLHGHGNATLAQAAYDQASTLEHVIFAGFTHKPAIDLASNLLTILPEGITKIFFSDNGSTAVEVGIKMALQSWYNRSEFGRKKIIAINGAYHGDTFGSMSVGERGLFTEPFNNYLFDVSFIDFPTEENRTQVLDSFKSLVSQGDVAAFIYEPLVQAAAGMRIYSSAILEELMTIAKEHDVVCIADEVFTGFGRTGKMFASDYMDSKPDIVAVSKGITGGTLPLGVTACNDNILDAFKTNEFSKTFFHGHSYTANPIACAVANASYRIFTSEQCQHSIVRISKKHLLFKEKIQQHKKLKDVRTLGTVIAFELDSGEITHYANEMRKVIYKYFLERDILLRPLGNIFYILPPYIITNEQLEKIYEAITVFLDEL